MDPDYSMELVLRAKTLDREAISELFEHYHGYIKKVVALRMGQPMSALLAHEDLVNDAILKVLNNLNRFKPRDSGSFRAWLSMVVTNEVKSRIREERAQRRGGARVRAFADYGSSVLRSSLLAGEERSPLSGWVSKESDERLHGALVALEERHREVIVLRSMCALDYGEIAREMGLESEGSARALLSRARVALAKVLRSLGEDGE